MTLLQQIEALNRKFLAEERAEAERRRQERLAWQKALEAKLMGRLKFQFLLVLVSVVGAVVALLTAWLIPWFELR